MTTDTSSAANPGRHMSNEELRSFPMDRWHMLTPEQQRAWTMEQTRVGFERAQNSPPPTTNRNDPTRYANPSLSEAGKATVEMFRSGAANSETASSTIATDNPFAGKRRLLNAYAVALHLESLVKDGGFSVTQINDAFYEIVDDLEAYLTKDGATVNDIVNETIDIGADVSSRYKAYSEA